MVISFSVKSVGTLWIMISGLFFAGRPALRPALIKLLFTRIRSMSFFVCVSSRIPPFPIFLRFLICRLSLAGAMFAMSVFFVSSLFVFPSCPIG